MTDTERPLEWSISSMLISEAVTKAREIGVSVCVAIVNPSGVLAASYRMPGAFLHSTDIALDKAYTAVSFGASTRDIAALLEGQPSRVRDGLIARPRFVAIGGGALLVSNGRVFGAIGVSGGTEAEDLVCVEAAVTSTTIDIT